ALGAAYSKGVSQAVAAAAFLGFMVWKFKVTLPFARIAKLLFACTVMLLGARAMGIYLGPLLGVIIGVPLGVAIFVLLMRWLRCLDQLDGDRLRKMERLLPGGLQRPFTAIVGFLVPPRVAVASPEM